MLSGVSWGSCLSQLSLLHLTGKSSNASRQSVAVRPPRLPGPQTGASYYPGTQGQSLGAANRTHVSLPICFLYRLSLTHPPVTKSEGYFTEFLSHFLNPYNSLPGLANPAFERVPPSQCFTANLPPEPPSFLLLTAHLPLAPSFPTCKPHRVTPPPHYLIVCPCSLEQEQQPPTHTEAVRLESNWTGPNLIGNGSS